MSVDAPATLNLEPESKENEVITVYVKGHRFVVTPIEALDIINQVSGVLLAHGHSTGREQGSKKYSIPV